MPPTRLDMKPLGVSFRTFAFQRSAMNRFPQASNARAEGPLRDTEVPAPDTPL